MQVLPRGHSGGAATTTGGFPGGGQRFNPLWDTANPPTTADAAAATPPVTVRAAVAPA